MYDERFNLPGDGKDNPQTDSTLCRTFQVNLRLLLQMAALNHKVVERVISILELLRVKHCPTSDLIRF
jgi:hypothetical protein